MSSQAHTDSRASRKGKTLAEQSSKVEYGITVSKDVMVAMRDQVRLATDIYRPADPQGNPATGKFPTIMVRTSYDKNNHVSFIRPVADFFTPRGYVTVLQDLRGRQQSEGRGQYFHTANVNEGRDGYDTIEWIAAQSWSNGRVGMVGSSHGGIVQNSASIEQPPHLSALWVDVAPTSAFTREAREGGAMGLHMFGALFLHAHDAPEIADNPVAKQRIAETLENMREVVWQTPFKPGHTPLTPVKNLEKILFHYYYDGTYNEFWSQECLDHSAQFHRMKDIPAVYSGGWYDPFAEDTSEQFTAMANKNKSPQRLLLGPWNHGGMKGDGTTYSGDVDFGEDVLWGDEVYNRHRLKWFDQWLKDYSTGIDDDAPVSIFVMGGGTGRKTWSGRLNHGGHWRNEQEWPPERTKKTSYYLRAGGSLGSEPGQVEGESASFTHDPAQPVPTIAANVTGFYEWVQPGEGLNMAYVPPRARMRQIVIEGGAHQREAPGIIGARPPYMALSTRPDVLVFHTEPLREDLEITGPVDVFLWISSSATDTDFTAKLIDVYPPNPDYPEGYDLNLADSIIRTRFRNGFEREEMMAPGETYKVKVSLPPISNLFKVGHRLRIDVSSSNFPRFDINPNTGEPLGRHTHTITAHNTVYLDRQRPSQVVLPVIPI